MHIGQSLSRAAIAAIALMERHLDVLHIARGDLNPHHPAMTLNQKDREARRVPIGHGSAPWHAHVVGVVPVDSLDVDWRIVNAAADNAENMGDLLAEW
jgi:hypothetical protein